MVFCGKLVQDFGGWTSAHGFPHIAAAKSRTSRCFWTLVVLCSITMLFCQIAILVNKYFRYPVTVETTLKFEELAFPAVTICDINPIRQSEIHVSAEMMTVFQTYSSNDLDEILTEFHEEYKTENVTNLERLKMRREILVQLLINNYFENNTIFKSEATFADEPLENALLNSTSPEERGSMLKEQFDNFFLDCSFGNRRCDFDKDFTIYQDPIYGRCYTFNHERENLHKISRAGPEYGLRATLVVNQSDYLPVTESVGVRIAVHEHNKASFPDAFGYDAAPGFATLFGIQYVVTDRLPYPYGDCSDEISDRPFFYQTSYSVEACFRSCLQQIIVDECGCADPKYAKTASDTFCTTRKIDCLEQFSATDENDFNETLSPNLLQLCDCPQPCRDSTYAITVSNAQWPTQQYKPKECANANYSELWISEGHCIEWYRANTLQISVYFERINYQHLIEHPAYEYFNMLADIGGQLGLWIGATIITMVEILTFIVLAVFFCGKRRPPKSADSAAEALELRQPITAENT